MLVKAGDTVGVKNRPRGLQLVKLTLQDNPPPVPDFLERIDAEPPEGTRAAPAHARRRRSAHPGHPRAAHHRILLPVTVDVA